MKSALILYEPEQVAFLDALVAKGGGSEKVELVSLDVEIDYMLERRGMPFISGKILQNRVAPASYIRSEELARTVCEGRTLDFLTYRNIHLLRPLQFSLHIYFIVLLHYIELVAHYVDGNPDIGQLIVPAPTTPISSTSGFLAEHEIFSAVEAVRRVAESRGLEFEIVQSSPVSLRAGNKLQRYFFTLKRAIFGTIVSVLNAYLSLQSRRPIRMVASDYWRNISPVLRELPDAEVFLLDRGEALKAGLSNIWRHKMRFVHIRQFLSRSGRKKALQKAKEYEKVWKSLRGTVWMPEELTFCGTSLESLCDRIMTRLIERAVPQVLCDIEGTYTMYERLAPEAVWVRASVSGQQHFAILPLVAKEMGIPALEVQHGGEYLGPGSATKNHAAYFFAAYGPLVCDEFKNLGYATERLLPMGSPRFDDYIRAIPHSAVHSQKSKLVVLSNTPTINVGERFGTYSIEEYFKALGGAVAQIPNIQLEIASRSASVRSFFSEETRARGLKSVPYEHVGTTPLPKLFQRADVFVCSYSTVVYEALLYRLPVVLAAFAPAEKMMSDFHFSRFEDAGALRIAHSPEELTQVLKELTADSSVRADMSAAGWDFMQKNFSFDGKASTRLAEQIRLWAKTTKKKISV